MKTVSKKYTLRSLLLLLILVIGVLAPVSAQAASFKKSKPKINKTSAYLNGSISLKWTKISGAKKYEIQRAKIDPSTGDTGKWKKWKTTKKPSIKVSGSGDYKYRVRAVKGKTYSKWSAAKRIFAAKAKITHMGYTEPNVVFGVTLSEGRLEFRVMIYNKTKSDMGFVPEGTRFDYQNTIYALNKKTGKVMKKWDGDLDIGKITGYAKMVEAGKSQSVYFYAYVTAEEWAKYKNCNFMISSSFYPNPNVESLSSQMAITYTDNIADCSLAAK